MGWSDRLQRGLLGAGLIISAVLLIRFAIDFSEGTKWWLAAPFWILVIAALVVALLNVSTNSRSEYPPAHRDTKRALLLAAIPVGFLASSLDCTGLSVQGCSPFCTFIKVVWIPLIACACAGYFLTLKRSWLTGSAVMSFVPLVPHCLCYNLGNGWWIDRIGASPLCYGWGFVVSVISVGALWRRAYQWASLAVCFAIIAGATGFFVTHHYFQFPW